MIVLKPTWMSEVVLILVSLLTVINRIAATSLAQPENKMSPRVIIVGAGVSGIGAANKLMRSGVTDVTILEAMDRIGGRINYVNLGEFGGVDLGGHWIHGQQGNVVYEMAKPLGLVRSSGDYENNLFFRTDGSELDFNQQYDTLYTKVTKATETIDTEEADQTNYEELVNKIVNDYGAKIKMNQLDLKSLRSFMQANLCTLESCQDLKDVSLKAFSEFLESGDHLVEWKTGGMSNVLDLLMGTHEKSPWKGLGVDKKIQLSSRVASLDWSSGNTVKVTKEDGSVLTADYVIVTPSLNVLKKKHSTLFKPSLPSDKIRVIQALGMDVVDKIYLLYKTPWWPKDVSSFNLLHSKFYPNETQDWGQSIISFVFESHNPRALGVWLAGRGAKAMELATEEEVKETVLRTLNTYLGKKYTITQPDKVIRSRWWNNQDVAGSYSYSSVAADDFKNPRGILARPLTNGNGKPMILFAGEASNRGMYSTVHGGLETGWREADRIVNYTKKASSTG